MKKIIILIFLVLSIIASLPLIGNKMVQNQLDMQIRLLESKGIAVTSSDEKSGYLKSYKHYELSIDDMNKLSKSISKDSFKKIFPYSNELLKGSRVGLDLEYSNIPFIESVSVDAYLIKLSDSMMDGIKQKDIGFHDYIDGFLSKQGVLYHIDYNILSQNFNGFLKDIDESYTLKNNSMFLAKVLSFKFNGNGTLLEPKEFNSKADLFYIDIKNNTDRFMFKLKRLDSSLNIYSKNSYNSNIEAEMFDFISQGSSVKIQNISLSNSFDTKSNKAKIKTVSSFDDLNISSQTTNISASDFKSDTLLSDVDKDSLEKFRVYMDSNKVDSLNSLIDAKESLLELLSKGMKFYIDEFYLKNINLNGENLGGLSVDSNLVLKEDKNLNGLIIYAPFLLINNLDLKFYMQMSKKVYKEINNIWPVDFLIQSYIKQKNDELIFDMILKDGNMKINGKPL